MPATLSESLEILVERKPLGEPDSKYESHRQYTIPVAVLQALAGAVTTAGGRELIKGSRWAYRISAAVVKSDE